MAIKIQGTTIINDQTAYIDLAGTAAIKVPVGTDIERPTGVTGQLRYNSTASTFEGYNGVEWGPIGPAGGGGGTVYQATVAGSAATSDWVGSDPWVATITVSGLLATDVPIVDIDLSGVLFSAVGLVQANWALVYRVEASANDELKLYAIEEPVESFAITIVAVSA